MLSLVRWALAVTTSLTFVPAILGFVACSLLGSIRRRTRCGLVVHAFSKRSFLDWSYVPLSTMETFFQRVSPCDWKTVSTALHPTSTGDNEKRHLCVLTFDDGREETYLQGLPLFEKYGVKASFFVIAGVMGKCADTGDVHGRQRFLSTSQVGHLASAGHEIGSHTLTHADLTLLSPTQLSRELRDSKKMLEDASGYEVSSLAFPYGKWNRRVWATAQEAGYRVATVLDSNLGLLPPEFLPVYGGYFFDTPADLVAKASGAVGRLAFARAHIMAHFAKGAPLWWFRPEYRLDFNGRSSCALPRTQ